jgi:hypothetical protein
MLKIHLHLSASMYVPEGQIHIMTAAKDYKDVAEVVAKIVEDDSQKYELVVYSEARRG